MPKVSQEYSETRRRQIIDAAYQCFARKGFHQTTMRDIYAEAKLSAGAVYHYFDSKEEIIQASFDFDYHRSRDLFTAAEASDDPMQALSNLLDFFFQGLKGAAALGAGRVNVQGWGEALVNPQLGAARREVINRYIQALALIISKAQESGQIEAALDPLGLSQLLMSAYFGLELQLALDPELDVDKYTAAVKTLLRSNSPQA
ncbi:MAG: TetR/AcrR family transcriptional regulator [Anaerolineae bacterium]|nr:TetR/AcrR family transcriptional regulator [Anaerolineae bacterium]